MQEPLLVVAEAHPLPRRGVVLSPRFVADPSLPKTFLVRLELPDGQQRTAAAEIQLAHVRGPLPPFGLLRLPELAPGEVPPGTRVFRAPQGDVLPR